MDIEQLKKFMNNKIESDNLSKKVRDKIKEIQWEKQDAREGFTESFKPLIESQEKVSEEINKQKKETLDQLKANQEAMNKNQLALTSGIKRLALAQAYEKEFGKKIGDKINDDEDDDDDDDKFQDAKEKLDEGTKKVFDINLNKNFDEDELKFLDKISLPRPNEIFNFPVEIIEEKIEETINIIKRLNGKRVSKKKGNITEQKKKDIEDIDNNQKILIKYKSVLKNLLSSKHNFQLGTGIYNNPNQLFNRLELLIGSINAGNDGVIPEFLNIVHILNKNKLINNNKLNSLINNISLNSG